MIYEILDNVGFYGPYILFAISLMLIKKRNVFFYLYIAGFVANYGLNYLLKNGLKQPRPDSDVHLLNVMKNDGRPIDVHLYGMPSGHMQESLYSLVFIALVTKKKNYVLAYAALSLMTAIQRFVTRKHSILQLIVGSGVGSFMGWLFFTLAEKEIKGKSFEKADDYNLVKEGFVN